jgi:hypothetical protein
MSPTVATPGGAAGRCAYCGGICRGRAGEGTWVCGMEHLLLLRLGASPGPGSPTAVTPTALRPRRAASGSPSGRYSTLSTGQSREVSSTRLLSTVRATRLRARTLCEDIDEGLSLAVEALRQGRVAEATAALGQVAEALGEIAGYLGVPPAQLRARVASAPAVSLAGALAAVPRLDCDLRAAVQGDRDAGREARRQALAMLRAVETELARRTAAPRGRYHGGLARRSSVRGGRALAACR